MNYFHCVTSRASKVKNHHICCDNINSKKTQLNPKRPGLFGLPNTRGGAESAHFGKRSLTPPNFISEQQTESHMKADIFF